MTRLDYTDDQRRLAAATALGRRDAGIGRFLGTTAAEWSVSSTTLRKWITEFFPESDPSIREPPVDGRTPYPLRGILWHRPCGQFIDCGRDATGQAYVCLTPCPRPLSIAVTDMHHRVIEAVSRSAPALLRRVADGAPDIYVVPGLIGRIIVGDAPTALSLTWRPDGYDRQAAARHAAPRRAYAALAARTMDTATV
jgi:hypothetical protein